MNESVEREFTRVDRFLRFGSELNVIHFSRRTTFRAFLRESEDFPKSRLKSIENIWSARRDDETTFSQRIERIVCECRLCRHSLPVLLVALFRCQLKDKQQSQFRSLAIRLLSESPLLRPTDVLLFCHLLGRKTINASRRVRASIRGYYSRDFSEEEIEEILVFKRQFDWTHRDVIRLCHVTPNPLTQQLMRSRAESETPIEKRLKVMRAQQSKAHQLVKALDESLLAPEFWFRALNTTQLQSAIVWTKTVSRLDGDALLRVVPRVVSRFPNNRAIFEALTSRMSKLSEVSSLLKAFVELFVQKSGNPLTLALQKSICLLKTKQNLEKPFLLVFSSDLERKYLSGIQNKRRQKDDVLDAFRVKDLALLFFKQFQAFQQKEELFVEFQEITRTSLQFPFEAVPDIWRRRLVFVTEEQPDISLWPKGENQLIVCHLNRREIKDLGFFRPNVLVLNGFDLKWEQIFGEFFGEKSV